MRWFAGGAGGDRWRMFERHVCQLGKRARALTDPVLLTEWLLPVVDLKLEPGAAFTFEAQPQPG